MKKIKVNAELSKKFKEIRKDGAAAGSTFADQLEDDAFDEVGNMGIPEEYDDNFEDVESMLVSAYMKSFLIAFKKSSGV